MKKYLSSLIYHLSSRKGFTLIELLVVIAVVGVLTAGSFVLINPIEQIKRTQDSKRKSDLAQIQKALEMYYQDNGRYPVASANFEITNEITNPEGSVVSWGTAWSSYMGTLPKDPGFPSKNYVYNASLDGQTYYIYASLDRGANDPQACNGGYACTTSPSETACGSTCNYGVSSPDVIVSILTTPTPTLTPTPTPTPTPKPAQTPVKTNYPSGSFGTYSANDQTTGYRFKTNVSGKITALWDYSQGGVKTLKLWSDTGTLLNSVTVTGSINTWVQGVLATPTSITAGTYYRVSTHLVSPGGYFLDSVIYPVTYGDITVDMTYFSMGDVFPVNSVPTRLLGMTDVSFIPD